MTIVIGSTDLQAETLPPGGKERQFSLNALIAAERASGLTNQLMIYTRQHPLAARSVDLKRLLDEIRPLLESALEEINIRWPSSVKPTCHPAWRIQRI